MASIAVNSNNQVIALFARSQPGVEGLIEVDDDDPRVVAFLNGQTASQLVAYANAKQATISAGGISVNVAASGAAAQMVEASTSTASLVLLQGAVSVAAANPSQAFNWIQASGQVVLTAAQIQAIFAAVSAFIQSTFTAQGAVLAAIAAGTITTTAQIDAFAWPANS